MSLFNILNGLNTLKSQSSKNKEENFNTLNSTNSHLVKCQTCNGYYVIKTSRTGDTFAGCSNYKPYSEKNCKTISLKKFIDLYFRKNGFNIYGWNRTCWKCHNETPVRTYLLNIDLSLADDYFEYFNNIGLGDVDFLDKYMSQKYTFIKMSYSKTVNDSYMANTCIHCKAIQGKNFIIDDPEILITSEEMDKYFIENISFEAFKANATDILKELENTFLRRLI